MGAVYWRPFQGEVGLEDSGLNSSVHICGYVSTAGCAAPTVGVEPPGGFWVQGEEGQTDRQGSETWKGYSCVTLTRTIPGLVLHFLS